ncbi:MAG TPA: helix-turn-helix domain-containing protein [Verrucomicrobiae bacterium]|jgi:HTH-type transcriptional regulator/antitoxin HigA|nr:helix-turn-helix domain-containing protein [Verrucomicrobiae bacterium]
MKTKTTVPKYSFKNLPVDYIGLIALLSPRPIRDAVDLANAEEMARALAGFDLSIDQADYLEALSVFIEQYERENVKWPRKRPTPLESLRHLMDERQMKAADLARLLGVHRTLGGMILRGERQLTVGHIKILAKHFGIAATYFM